MLKRTHTQTKMGKKKRSRGRTQNAPPDHHTPLDPCDLFNNPVAQAAMAALSEEDKARYKIIGEHLYNRMDYGGGRVLNALPTVDGVTSIEVQLRSGLHPSMMEEHEKTLMADTHGVRWYENWGFVEDDMEGIVTLEPAARAPLGEHGPGVAPHLETPTGPPPLVDSAAGPEGGK